MASVRPWKLLWSEIVFHRADTTRGVATQTIWRGPRPQRSVHAGPVLDFVEAIATGRQPLTPLRHALPTTQIIQAVYESAGTGGLAPIAAVQL